MNCALKIVVLLWCRRWTFFVVMWCKWPQKQGVSGVMFAKGIPHCFLHWDAYNDSALRAAAECHFVFSFFFSLATLGYLKE